nr:immunoglobulin light chain junction region [Macaca mulatta]MOX26310.1 immunoglobulin light chain junction region [Macaca mulatta]MOX27118.1 immunoglobulin light chain junction region [Macaca mulatta]MOY10336.1 immunoglobulin light chain junction region [Macaca mulatta]MOY10385.1 immunoglobulin light chain junction region [Macaca mulatta]
CMQALDFYSF